VICPVLTRGRYAAPELGAGSAIVQTSVCQRFTADGDDDVSCLLKCAILALITTPQRRSCSAGSTTRDSADALRTFDWRSRHYIPCPFHGGNRGRGFRRSLPGWLNDGKEPKSGSHWDLGNIVYIMRETIGDIAFAVSPSARDVFTVNTDRSGPCHGHRYRAQPGGTVGHGADTRRCRL
jgi:hypothetical protein